MSLATCTMWPVSGVVCRHRQAGTSQSWSQSPIVAPGNGPEDRGPRSLLSPAPGPDNTYTHTCTHSSAQGWQYSPRPASLREARKRWGLWPQPAHSGHHSPRRRCYKTWCGVCGSDGHAFGSGMAPCPVTAADGENVKIHSSPPQRMGSALHTGMYRCLGAPGISSGRAGGHG